MKKILLLTFTCILCFNACNNDDTTSNRDLYGNNPDAFITLWNTDYVGEPENNQIEIPGSGTNYKIFWEEVGNPNNNGLETATNSHIITFTKAGIYKVSISGGTPAFHQIKCSSLNSRKIISIEQWGTIEWSSFNHAFYLCYSLEIHAKDSPNLENVKDMNSMFEVCWWLENGVSDWNVSKVTDMSKMFSGARNFNGDISSWDVSSVTNMAFMFSSNHFFNQDISNWDVSNVTNMAFMFTNTRAFNQDISSWDVSNVYNMTGVFAECRNFNQDISSWDVSKVISMHGMFVGAESFNQDISGWDVSNVTDMSYMFSAAESFNQNISDWDVSNVTECFYFSENSGLELNYIPSLQGGCN
jgi:surface protein